MVCGKETGSSQYICDECSRPRESHDGITRIKIRKCPNCGRVMYKAWDDIDRDNVPKSILENALGLSVKEFSTSGDERNIRIKYIVNSKEKDESLEESLVVQVSSSTCPMCTKKLGNYYEATIQIRGALEGEKDVIKYIDMLVEHSPSGDVFITRIDRRKEGHDVLLSDKKFARAAARKAIERFGGTLKETSHLVGLKDGNELYRITISMRLPDFKRGDVISLADRLFMVKLIRGDILTLVDIRAGSALKMKFRDLENYSVFSAKENIREARVLYRQGDTAYVMDPFDFKEKAVLSKGDSKAITVIKIGEELIAIESTSN
ncbi:MAG: NMD3-related protein [Thermoplasmatales archaeon]